MCADIERNRVYSGIRDCMDKMKKVEGNRSFYRGFSLALPHLMLQYGLTTQIYSRILA